MDLHFRITNHNSLNTEFKIYWAFTCKLLLWGKTRNKKVKKVQTLGDEMSTILTE